MPGQKSYRAEPFAVAVIALVLLVTSGAHAAPPAYCALYAREQAKSVAAGRADGSFERTLDQAFYQCLNLDEKPPFPEGSAYVGDDLIEPELPVAEDTASIAAAADPNDTTTMDSTAEGDTDFADAPEPATPQKSRSGLRAWSPEWKAWCEEHFPNSFDPETGTVLPFEGGRSFC